MQLYEAEFFLFLLVSHLCIKFILQWNSRCSYVLCLYNDVFITQYLNSAVNV